MRGFMLAALVAILVCAGPARAQGFYYDCDTPSEHSSFLRAAPHAGAQRISGSINVTRMYRSRRFATAAMARIEGPNGEWWARILITGSLDHGSDALTAYLEVKRAGQEPERSLLGYFRTDIPVAFSLSRNAAGGGSGTVGPRTVNFSLPDDRPSVASVSCTTGEAIFSDLVFGS